MSLSTPLLLPTHLRCSLALRLLVLMVQLLAFNATIKGMWLPASFLVIRKLEDHLFGISLARRFHNVSSNALRPTWVPYASTEVGKEVLLFSLKLMMGWCSFFIHSALWIRLFQNCSSLQMTGPMRGLHTCISWVTLLILRHPWRCTTMFHCVCLWTTVWPLKYLMWPLFRDIPSLRIMGKVDAVAFSPCNHFLTEN